MMIQSIHIKTITAFVMVLFLVFACDTREEKLEKQKMNKEITNKMMENLGKPDQEIVALLAVKYSKNITSVEDIIDTYLSNTDYLYRGMKLITKKGKGEASNSDDTFDYKLMVLGKSEYADTVIKISNQFSIDPTVVASILFDYKIWNEAQSDTVVE